MQEMNPVITEERANKMKRDIIELIEHQYGIEITKVVETPKENNGTDKTA